MNEVMTIILGCAGTVLAALAGWAAERLIVYLNGKIAGGKAEKYIKTAIEIIGNAVKQTYQTYVDTIKDTDMWTAEAQKTALNKALETVKALLPAAVKEFITSTYGDLESYLITQIESQIYDLKNLI